MKSGTVWNKLSTSARVGLALLPLVAAETAHAQEQAVRSALTRATSLGTSVMFAIAVFMVLGGVVAAFWSMSQGDQDAKRKAMWAMGGGLGVGMATKIVQAMFDIGGAGVSL
ncbi:MAG: DUF4134 family protein [Deltaproteobacteria bacterium]|nr:DUF4134 family protein [Deltaproteobacteria bacterium]